MQFDNAQIIKFTATQGEITGKVRYRVTFECAGESDDAEFLAYEVSDKGLDALEIKITGSNYGC